MIGDTRHLKSLMVLLGTPPRLRIVDAIVRIGGGGAEGRRAVIEDIASALSMAPYEIEPHLTALHEGGVLVLEEDGERGGVWGLSPKVTAEPDGDFLHFAARTLDGCDLEVRLRPDGEF